MRRDEFSPHPHPLLPAPDNLDVTTEGWPHPSIYPPSMVRVVDAMQEKARRDLASLKAPPGYDGPPDLHLYCHGVDPPGPNRRDLWRCHACGSEGPIDDLMRRGGCFPGKNCEHCGYGPLCALDCPGIAAVLGDEKVYVAGTVQGDILQ